MYKSSQEVYMKFGEFNQEEYDRYVKFAAGRPYPDCNGDDTDRCNEDRCIREGNCPDCPEFSDEKGFED